ncbi:MAG: NAD(P)-dependent oxidoreductase, partial [Candidatus Aminicenantes bacterium]|nr:NAD(P)-dependent oxidoreductase [Candidatus Aminicenantes bacterium]
PQPITHYGKSKLLGELEALKFKDIFPLVILRISAVYGPRDPDVLNYIKFIKRGFLPSLGSKQRRLSLCYVKDVTRALHLSSRKDVQSGEIFNIADQNPYSWDDIGENAGRRLGKKLRKVNVPFFLVFLAALVVDLMNKIRRSPNIFGRDKFKDMKQSAWIADTRKASEMLSFRSQYSLEKGVQETVDWYLENNWL